MVHLHGVELFRLPLVSCSFGGVDPAMCLGGREGLTASKCRLPTYTATGSARLLLPARDCCEQALCLVWHVCRGTAGSKACVCGVGPFF